MTWLKKLFNSPRRKLLRARQRRSAAAKVMAYLASDTAAPDSLFIEPTNICNANCIFCAYQFDQRPKASIPDQIFTDAVDQYCDAGGEKVGLTPFAGEIFVDRKILDKVRYIAGKQVKRLHSYTNATLLHRHELPDLLNAGFTELRISLAPPDAELHEKIFRNGSYQRVIENVRDLLIAFRDAQDSKVKEIAIEFRADRSLAECETLPDYQTYIAPYLSPGVTLSAMQVYDGWSGMITESDLLPGMTIKSPEMPKKSPCARIFNLQVLADGDMRLCGCRYDNDADKDELSVGNIESMTVIEAFNSEAAKEKILSFQNGELMNVCKKCSWYEAA